MLSALLLALAAAPQVSAEAVALWDAGNREQALALLEAALERRPDDPELRADLARRQLQVHRYQAALDSAGPLGPELAPVRARALYGLAHYAEAVELLDPTVPETALLRIDALLALGRVDRAEEAIRAAVGLLGPDDLRLRRLQAQSLARRGDHEGAIPLFRSALEADSWDLASLYGLGRSLVSTGRREEGLATLERHRALVPLMDRLDFALKSLDLQPLHAPNHANVGDVERELGRTDRALAAYARAEELATPDEAVPVALRHARCLAEDRDDLEGALAVLDRAAELAEDVRLHVRAGDLLQAAGEHARAAERFAQALELRPGDAQIEARLAAARAEEP